MKDELLVIKSSKNKFTTSLASFLESEHIILNTYRMSKFKTITSNFSIINDDKYLENTNFQKDLNSDLELKEFCENLEKIYFIRNYLESHQLIKLLDELNGKKLKILNFTANCISIIPAEINFLENLEILVLNNNKIKFVENIDKLKKLKRLELKGNSINEISNESVDFLIKSQNLEFLSLSCNLLTTESLKNFLFLENPFNIFVNKSTEGSNLKELGLFGNKIGVENYFIEEHKSLKNECDIKILSKNLSLFFPNLEILYISGNGFANEKNLKTIINKDNFLKKII